MEDTESNLLTNGRSISRDERETFPPLFLKTLQVLERRFYSFRVMKAVEWFVGEMASMIPRPAKATDPGVTLLWVLGAYQVGTAENWDRCPAWDS